MVFPDIPGVGAMGRTVDEALLNAEDALRDYATEAERDGVEQRLTGFVAQPMIVQSRMGRR